MLGVHTRTNITLITPMHKLQASISRPPCSTGRGTLAITKSPMAVQAHAPMHTRCCISSITGAVLMQLSSTTPSQLLLLMFYCPGLTLLPSAHSAQSRTANVTCHITSNCPGRYLHHTSWPEVGNLTRNTRSDTWASVVVFLTTPPRTTRQSYSRAPHTKLDQAHAAISTRIAPAQQHCSLVTAPCCKKKACRLQRIPNA